MVRMEVVHVFVCVCLSESSGKRHRKALDGLPEDGDQATKRIVLVYKVLVTGFDCLTGGHMFFVSLISSFALTVSSKRGVGTGCHVHDCPDGGVRM